MAYNDISSDMLSNRVLYDLIKRLMSEGKWGEAIKYVRSQYPVSLAVARDLVESIRDDGQFPVKMQVERLQYENEVYKAACNHKAAVIDALLDRAKQLGFWGEFMDVVQDLDDEYSQS